MANIAWNNRETAELNKVAFLSVRFGGPLNDPPLAHLFSQRFGDGLLEARRKRKNGADEFTAPMIRARIKELIKKGLYPMPEWKTSEECQGLLERVRGEEKAKKALKQVGRPGAEPKPPKSKRIPWSDPEMDLLVEKAYLMHRFGGYMSDNEFARYLSTLVGPGKFLKSRRDKGEHEDEFSPGIIRYNIQNLLGERDRRLPELAKENSKVKRPLGSGLGMGEDNMRAMSGGISAQTKANHSAGNTGSVAIGEPSRKRAHEGPLMQAEKRHEHYPQRTSVSGPVEASGAHPRHGGIAGISGMAKEMSMLNPYQHPSPQQLQQANATSEARLPTGQIQAHPVNEGRDSQQSPIGELHPSIPDPILPFLPRTKPQPTRPFNFPPPPRGSKSHMKLPPLTINHPHMPNLLSPTTTNSSQSPSLRTLIGHYDIPSLKHLPPTHQDGHKNPDQQLPSVSALSAYSMDNQGLGPKR